MGAVGAGIVLNSCTSEKKKTLPAPVFYDSAPDGPLLKAGLIGCGGRGTGAAINFLNAGPNLKITSIGDVFQRQIDSCRERLKEQKGVDIAVHQIEMVNRYFGQHPVKALGFGGRHRRLTGNVYDFYSVEYEFEDGRIFNCKTRFIDGCDNKFGFKVFGTNGYTNCQNKIWDNNHNLIWEYEYPLDKDGRSTSRVAISSYDEEHINFVTAIRTGQSLTQAQKLANAIMCGIMGRESAITGKVVSWDDMMSSDLKLGPTEYAFGPVSGFDPLPPVPGVAQDITQIR